MPSNKVTVSKTSKKTAPKKSKTPALVQKTAPVTVEPATNENKPVSERIQALQTAITLAFTTFRKELTSIQKEYAKEKRILERQAQAAQKKKKSGGHTTVSGIAKPGYISPELCKFIGRDVGTEMARTEVIKHVNQYIKTNGLQDSKNKRIIRPDSKLQSLLNTKKSDEVTYFNLQTYMKPHYANPSKTNNLNA